MGIRVLSPGPLTTVQDGGRYGYQQYGFTPAGAMDMRALRLGNLLVGNDENEAALEMTMLGASFAFNTAVVVAVTGADMQPMLCDVMRMPMNTAFPVQPGQTLSFGMARDGCRCYLAVAGGLDIPVVMGSRATHIKSGIGGLGGRALKAGDELPLLKPRKHVAWVGRKPVPYAPYGSHAIIRVVPGPQQDYFTQEGIETFYSQPYTVTSQSDRMGYKLDGPAIAHAQGADIISDAIVFGSVQVPSGGKPIIMMADRQTSGGYAKIATVCAVDLPLLAQCRPGDTLHFQAVTVRMAQRLLRRQEKALIRLEKRLRLGGTMGKGG